MDETDLAPPLRFRSSASPREDLPLLSLDSHRHGRRPAVITFLLALATSLLFAGTARSVTYPPDFEEQTVIGGLTMPTAVAYTPDGRTLIAEKSGQLKLAAPGASTATTILDMGNQVNAYWDRGFLGLAVDASFQANHFIYLLYTYELNPGSPDGSGPMVSRLTRAVLNPDSTVGPQTVLLGSYVSGPCGTPSNTLDCIPSDGASHSIGSVRAAPDGSLYVGSGDASSFGAVDPMAFRSYDEASMAGKIMHVDRNGNGLASHPFCPSETDLTKVCTKVYAKGLRNPFRFVLRPGNAGLTVGDVGWNTREEVDLVPTGGKSYGWPCYEGTIRTPGYQDRSECPPEYAKEGTANAHVAPVYDWAHSVSNAAIGGPTYTSDQFPSSYRDSIFVGDYAGRFLKRLELNGSDQVTAVHDFAGDWSGVDIEMTPGGDLVYVSFGTPGMSDGALKRIVYTPGNRTPSARASAFPTSGTPPLAVAFDASASSDPDGDVLTYSWDFGDGTSGSGVTPSHTYASSGSYTARVTVDDGRGRSDSATVPIDVGSSRPVVKIEAPVDGSTYRDGEPVTIRGSATDIQDGDAPRLRVLVGHHAQAHRPQPCDQPAPGRDGDDVRDGRRPRLRLLLRDHAHGDRFRRQHRHGQVDHPARGRQLRHHELAGRSGRLLRRALRHDPVHDDRHARFQDDRDCSGPLQPERAHIQFSSWSDGGARVHDITIPAAASTLTANYRDDGPAGPVAALAFDEGAGATARDTSGFGNDGAISGATWTTAGKYGPGLTFDGVNDWVTVPDADSLDIRGPLTLEAWVMPRDKGAWDNIVMKEAPGSHAYVLYATGDALAPVPNGAVGSDEAFAPSGLPTGAWTHVAVTFDGSALRIYVDGTLVTTRTGASPPPVSTNPLRIGGDAVWSDEFFDGSLDEIRVYDRALTAAEITSDMNTRIGAPPVDTAAPSVAITAPEANATVGGATEVRADATDDTGVAGVRFVLDGNDLGAEDTSAPYGVLWDTTTAANGQHTLTAVARDAAGNTTTSAPRSVVVSNGSVATAPVPASAPPPIPASAPPPTSPPATPVDQGSPKPTTPAQSTQTVRFSSKQPKLRGNRKVALRLSCRGTRACKGSITVRTGKRKLATGRLSLRAGTSATVKLRLGKKARRAIKGKRKLKLRVTVKLLKTASGEPSVRTVSLKLKGRA